MELLTFLRGGLRRLTLLWILILFQLGLPAAFGQTFGTTWPARVPVSDKLKMGEFVNPRWLNISAWVLALVIAGLNAFYLWQVFSGSAQ
jgi:hypothetical protein